MYRIQENERYKFPTKPWIYFNDDATKSIVAPVIRKITNATSKPREHFLLK
jgi:hypothetical protein